MKRSLILLSVILICSLSQLGSVAPRLTSPHLPKILSQITAVKLHNFHEKLLHQGISLHDVVGAFGAEMLLSFRASSEVNEFLNYNFELIADEEKTVFWILKNEGEERHLFFKKGHTPNDQIESELSRKLSYTGSISVENVGGDIQFRQEDWDINHVYQTIIDYAEKSKKYVVDHKTPIEFTRISYSAQELANFLMARSIR